MIITATIGAAAAAFLEIRIVGALPSLKSLAMRNKLFGLFLSFLISQALAVATGTTGVTSMLIFIISTIFTQAIYSAWGLKARLDRTRNKPRRILTT